MTQVNRDKTEGYPGDLMVQISFELTADNCFKIHTTAMCTKPTPVSITNQIYFNLAGHVSNPIMN